MSREPRRGARRGARPPRGWQGLGSGSQPPGVPPCPALSGAPEQKVFDITSQWGAHSGKQTPAALISTARARRAGGGRSGQAGRPGLSPRSHSPG